jgi:hypothetical protein
VRIGPARKLSVDDSLNAVTSGDLPITAQLRTRTGRPYAAAVSVLVQVRAYGQIATVVLVTVIALLVIAAVIRTGLRIVRSRRGAAT